MINPYFVVFFRAAQICLALFSLSIFFSYALQFYVLMEIFGPNVIKPLVPDRWYSPTEYLTRVILNVITCEYIALIYLFDLNHFYIF